MKLVSILVPLALFSASCDAFVVSTAAHSAHSFCGLYPEQAAELEARANELMKEANENKAHDAQLSTAAGPMAWCRRVLTRSDGVQRVSHRPQKSMTSTSSARYNNMQP